MPPSSPDPPFRSRSSLALPLTTLRSRRWFRRFRLGLVHGLEPRAQVHAAAESARVLPLVLRTDEVMNEAPAPAPWALSPDVRARARFEALSVSGSPGESDASPSRLRLGLLRLFRSENPAVIIVLRRRDLPSLRSDRGGKQRGGARAGGVSECRRLMCVCVRARARERARLARVSPRGSLRVGRSDARRAAGGTNVTQISDCEGEAWTVGPKRTSPPGSRTCSRRICRGGGSSAWVRTSAKHPGCLEKWPLKTARP